MLVAAILDGQLLPDTALPSSRELADQLSVSRNTVVLAYQQLVEEGYLISRERSGHFVNPAMLEGRHGFMRRRRPCPAKRPTKRSQRPDWGRRLGTLAVLAAQHREAGQLAEIRVFRSVTDSSISRCFRPTTGANAA